MSGIKTWVDVLFQVVEVAAILAFALSGILEAAHKRLDAVGACVVAFLASFGGGTLRDLLLDQRPFFWVRHVEALWGVLALSILAMIFLRRRHFHVTEQAIMWPDAIGLGLCAATGVQQALQVYSPPLVAVLMGVITGVFGGVLRDVVCNEIPAAFKDRRPYAVCAFIGGWFYVGLWALGAPDWVSLVSCMGVTAGLRALALRGNMKLPVWEPSHPADLSPPSDAPPDILPSKPQVRQKHGRS
jgi:uncharacterized membrane protein YeiH